MSFYGDHVWPENLYDEMYHTGIVSFFCYTLGYLVDAARQNDDFVGLSVDGETNQIYRSQIPDEESVLKRSFTPAELKSLIEDNLSILSKYGSDFSGDGLTTIYKWLDTYAALSEESGLERPLTIEEFDDKYQKKEPVYGIFKDSLNKRIIVAFRGSDKLAFLPNWMTNAFIVKKEGITPSVLEDDLDGEKLYFHSGFYNSIFNETEDPDDEGSKTKFDQICSDVKALLAKNPDYMVYCCGHSLGAALSTIAAFYLSCEPDIPKPVSNINFASPRVGSESFLKAAQLLEQKAQLRILRSVNENDTVTVVPSIGYHHVGFQVTAYKQGWFRWRLPDPDIHYPNPKDGFWSKLGWDISNSMVTSFNLGYDHGDYLERIVAAKDFLETKSLNSLYADEDFVGFRISPGV